MQMQNSWNDKTRTDFNFRIFAMYAHPSILFAMSIMYDVLGLFGWPILFMNRLFVVHLYMGFSCYIL